MTKYVDKSALIAEIDRRKRRNVLNEGAFEEDIDILSYIDTLEVQEVDLEKEVESYWNQYDLTWCKDSYSMTCIRSMFSDIAKRFFKLGLKAKGE